MSIDYADPRTPAHNLHNATILQIVPSMHEEMARAAVNVAYVLVEAGARAIIAAEPGPLAPELRSYGGEWVPLRSETLNPGQLVRAKRALENMIMHERVDIVHAHNAGGAWSARAAAAQLAVWFVTSIPDRPMLGYGPRALHQRSLTFGDRIIAPSIYAAKLVINRYKVEPERLTVIPRSVDTQSFNPDVVTPERVRAVQMQWRVLLGQRVVLVPGRVARWNGQHIIPEVARILSNEGLRDTIFVIAGENRSHARYARRIEAAARSLGVEPIVRLTGHCPDMPAAMAAADVVVVPAIEPPILGRVVAEAQAMGKPVVTSGLGTLPENVVVPPRIPAELRTGWVVKPGDAKDLARALAFPLSMDRTAYQAAAARARQFAEYMFSPPSIARATRAVYTSILARDT